MESLDTRTIVNHFGLVIDESSSMTGHARNVVLVTDGLVRHLSLKSREMEQETRLSVYAFNSRGTARCLVWDTDVLRIPSIVGKYHPQGLTSLIDCTALAIEDHKLIPFKYGEQSVWIDAITDGQENNSLKNSHFLSGLISGLPGEWTVTAHVPDRQARQFAERAGFHPGNIELWDPSGSFEQVGESLLRSADRFMEGRRQGVRGYKTGGLFRLADFTASDVKQNLTRLTQGSYYFAPVRVDEPISPFVSRITGHPYDAGSALYQLTKTETIQSYKKVAVRTDGDDVVYSGRDARDFIGLPDYDVKVKPDYKQGCTIFVQSTSHNRKLIGGTEVLILR